MKYCQYCGVQIDQDAVVCPKCGKQVKDLKTTESSYAMGWWKGDRIMNILWESFAIVCAVVGLVCGMIAMFR